MWKGNAVTLAKLEIAVEIDQELSVRTRVHFPSRVGRGLLRIPTPEFQSRTWSQWDFSFSLCTVTKFQVLVSWIY